jgi:hypothetical protein
MSIVVDPVKELHLDFFCRISATCTARDQQRLMEDSLSALPALLALVEVIELRRTASFGVVAQLS